MRRNLIYTDLLCRFFNPSIFSQEFLIARDVPASGNNESHKLVPSGRRDQRRTALVSRGICYEESSNWNQQRCDPQWSDFRDQRLELHADGGRNGTGRGRGCHPRQPSDRAGQGHAQGRAGASDQRPEERSHRPLSLTNFNNNISPLSLKTIDLPLKKTNALSLEPSERNFLAWFNLN